MNKQIQLLGLLPKKACQYAKRVVTFLTKIKIVSIEFLENKLLNYLAKTFYHCKAFILSCLHVLRHQFIQICALLPK